MRCCQLRRYICDCCDCRLFSTFGQIWQVRKTLQTRNIHALQLSADHQGDCFPSCENSIISTFIHFRSSQTVLVTFPSLPWYWPCTCTMIMCNLRGLNLQCILYSFVPLKNRLLLLVPGITDNKWNLKTGHCNAKTAHGGWGWSADCSPKVKCRLVARCRMRTADLGWNSSVTRK